MRSPGSCQYTLARAEQRQNSRILLVEPNSVRCNPALVPLVAGYENDEVGRRWEEGKAEA